MITVNLNDELSKAVEEMARHQHKTAEQLVNDAVLEMLEDYHDIKAAESAIARIESGEEKVLSWEEVKTGLYDLED